MAQESAKIIALDDGLPIVPNGEPVRGVVEKLEMLLGMARAGELRGLAYVAVGQADHFMTNWAGDEMSSLKMVGGISFLLHEYQAATLRRMENGS